MWKIEKTDAMDQQNSIVQLQSIVRGRYARRLLKRQQESATLIQTTFRRHFARQRRLLFGQFKLAQTELDAQLALQKKRQRTEQEYSALSVMSASRVKTYMNKLEQTAAITSKYACHHQFLHVQFKRT